jgi:hypothetical protein
MKAPEFTTRFYVSEPAPGIASQNRPFDALLGACEAVSQDIQNQGAVTYETVQKVREALALARRQK